jgi:hypothetical protein
MLIGVFFLLEGYYEITVYCCEGDVDHVMSFVMLDDVNTYLTSAPYQCMHPKFISSAECSLVYGYDR